MTTTERNLIPVVDYSRASFDKAKDEHTVRDQQSVNDQTAARLGCKIVARFADNDKSAAKESVVRHNFEAMLKVLRAGALADGTPVMGCIVVADDRLVRRAGDYERFVDAITYDEGRVFADKRGFKDLYSEDVESMGLMGAVISRMEVKKMRRRARQWHRTRAERGTAPGAPRPFGWSDDRISLNLREAELIRNAVEAFIAGQSISSIVREWQSKGVQTPRGNAWKVGTLRRALENPRLCGWRAIKGELVTDADGTPVSGEWEPIITPEQWRAISAIVRERTGHNVSRDGAVREPLARDHREHRYLLTGFLRCGRIKEDGTMCGMKLRAGKVTTSSGHRYVCPAPGVGGCGRLGRRGDMVDSFISEAVIAKLEERAGEFKRAQGAWLGQAELDDREEQMRELRERFRQRRISNSLYFDMVEELEKDISRLRVERDRYSLAVERSAIDLTDIRRRWYSETDDDRLDLSRKRAYVRKCFVAIIVHPAGSGTKFNPDLLEPVWRED
ncbi:recombinase family protein [Spirillospora sp. CA-108201]